MDLPVNTTETQNKAGVTEPEPQQDQEDVFWDTMYEPEYGPTPWDHIVL
jgi:hypothetical protein